MSQYCDGIRRHVTICLVIELVSCLTYAYYNLCSLNGRLITDYASFTNYISPMICEQPLKPRGLLQL